MNLLTLLKKKYLNILLDTPKFWIDVKIALKFYLSGVEDGIISVHINFLNFNAKTNKVSLINENTLVDAFNSKRNFSHIDVQTMEGFIKVSM